MWGEVEVWGEIRSPVLAAPSFNNCIGTNSSTHIIDGEDDEKTQAANDLCNRYLPLALKIARDYGDKGIHFEDLRSAAYLGLVSASRKFDPARGAFGPYAKPWIKGEITRLFKPNADAMAFGRSEALNVPTHGDDDDRDYQRDVASPAPTIMPDLSALAETDRYIVQSRLCGETLAEIGKALGISSERVRQREARLVPRLKGS